jgi:chanoclavine-I dehydrogenase
MVALPKGSRSIVNIANIAALVHGPDTFGYSTSKAGGVHLSLCLAKDVLPLGIRLNAVSPGVLA